LDADQSHATTTRYYKEFTQALTLDQFESTDAIMECALEADQQVVVDLPAQSQRFLDRWIDDNGVLDMCEEMNIPIVFWNVVDD
ncbi:mobilization protein, partial [Gilvimarinus sp. 1_MG-2023]|nr:mobilization protein [Gilvimarinus sp. 1_MG-2023]